MKIPKRTSWVSYATSLVLLVAAIGFSWFVNGTVKAADFDSWALTNQSPHPWGMIDLSVPETPYNPARYGTVVHLLKNMESSYVPTLRLGAYFPTQVSTGRVIQIRKARVCNIDWPQGQGLRVKITPQGGAARTYNISRTQVCADYTPGRVNVVAGSAGENQNDFFVDYAVPNDLGAGSYDSRTGLYKLDIEFTTPGPQQAPDADPTDEVPNQVRFRVTVAGSAGAKIGMLGNSASTHDFGLVAEYNDPGHGVMLGIPFGMACDLSPRQLALRIYDADEHIFGPIRIWVLEKSADGTVRRLAENEFNAGTNVEWVNAGQGWFVTNSGASGTQSIIRIANGQPDKRYLMVIYNPSDGTTPINGTVYVRASQNVFSIGIPSDAILGDIPCDYQLQPSVDGVDPNFISTPDLRVEGRVSRSGGVDSDGPHDWQLSVFRFDTPPTNAERAPKDNTTEPCSLHPARPCQSFQNGNRTFDTAVFQSGYQTFDGGGLSYPPGTRFCFVMSVKKPSYSASADTWRHSEMSCSVAGKSPKFQVWGGDVRVGGWVNTSVTTALGRKWGSWSEYGLYLNGLTDTMGSGNGLMGGVDPNLEPGSWSRLTFANVDIPDPFGNFGQTVNPFIPPLTPGDPNNINLGSAPTVTIGPGSPCLNGFGARDKRICYAENTIVIDRDIIYDGNYANAEDIPQLVIIAGDIAIDDDVEQVDAWLVTEGRLSTCASKNFEPVATAALSEGQCNKQLKLNGPVTTNQLYLYRTHGSATPTDQDVPAEIFNLRPNVYLSAYAGRPTGRPVATTDTVNEVPPRF